MNHYCVLMNQIHSYSDSTTKIKNLQKVIIRSKGELTDSKIKTWIKRNTTDYIAYEFIKVIGDGTTDRTTMNYYEGTI